MTQTLINAVGEPPSADRVRGVAARALGDGGKPVPAFVTAAVAAFLTNHPGDNNFLIELGSADAPYGIVTCIEDDCWNDIPLTATASTADGGLANRLGSLEKYAVHCAEEQHTTARNVRLRKQGVAIPSSRPVQVESDPESDPEPEPRPELKVLGDKGKGRTLPTSDAAPTPPIAIDSDSDSESDDGITFLGSSAATRPAIPVVELDDDSDDDRPSVKPEAKPDVKPTRPQPKLTRPPHVEAWLTMPLADRQRAVKHELDAVRSLRPTDPVLNATIRHRKNELKMVERSFGIRQWVPPTHSILRILPRDAVHSKLRDTFPWPEPAPPAPAPTQAPIATPVPQPSLLDVMRAWGGVDRATRIESSRAEQTYLGQMANLFNGIPALRGIILDRVLQAARRVLNPDTAPWTPPPPALLTYIPQLRKMAPPVMQPFISAHPGQILPQGMPGQFDMDDFGFEADRPQTADGLATLFQGAMENFVEDATVDDALNILKLASLDDKLEGANFTLLPHQVLGVAFMVKREELTTARGGLLCDAMGLGKTVQTLGIMLARDTRPVDFTNAPQLIIAPVAVLAQWKAEIESKTTKRWRILIHHGQTRAKSAASLKQYDIVLTSYGTLRSEVFPHGKKKKKQNFAPSDDDDDDEPPARTSPLAGTKWFRVILDEAHYIRNRGTSTCKAIMTLDVLHPWFLTGTPVVNSLKDLAPALRFLGVMDYDEFQRRVGKIEKNKPRLATKRSQAILRPLIMRRNKESEINGHKILQLPPKTTNLTSLEFDSEERRIYVAIEQRARVQINKFIKAGTLMKNYSVVLVLLTRLRQCVNHPWLLRRKPGEEGDDRDILVEEGVDEEFGGQADKSCKNDADEYARAVALVGADTVDSIKRKLEDRYLRMVDESSDEDQDMECGICYEPFDGTELVTPCQHIFCKTCVGNLFTAPARDATVLNEDQASRGCRSCPMCRAVIERGRIFRATAIFKPQEDVKVDEDEKPQKGKKRTAGAVDFFAKRVKMDPENEETEVDEEEFPPSTKMKKLLELIQGYLAEDPNVKILVFSQFVQFIQLSEDYLAMNGIRTITYRGSMSQADRTEAIRRFSLSPLIADSIPVMIISTKAGGVGLNLTMASKVIMCDLAWNPATENQAVDRAHRIGQSRPVIVERLVIADSVEDRLLEIQQKKGLLADGAMGEGTVSKIGRLTVDNIRRLFAMTEDADDL